MTEKQMAQKESAKAFARNVIEKDFGQEIDDEALESVAMKILRALPKDQGDHSTLESA